MADILQSLDWSPLLISLKTGVVATIVLFSRYIRGGQSGPRGTKSQGCCGRNSDAAYGASTYGSRIFSSADLQQEKALWNISV